METGEVLVQQWLPKPGLTSLQGSYSGISRYDRTSLDMPQSHAVSSTVEAWYLG